MRKTMLVPAAAVVVLAMAGGLFVYGAHRSGAAQSSVLIGSDFGRLRRDALAMFPRGSPVTAAAEALKTMGFQCTPIRHMLANINAPSTECESAGRGYPQAARLQVTVLARNGMVADIAVGNGFDTFLADARTPDPVEQKTPATAAGGSAAAAGE